MQYAFGWNEKATDSPDFLPDIHESFLKTAYMGHAVKQFPWLIDIMDTLPEWLVVKIVPALAASLDRKRVRCPRIVRAVLIDCVIGHQETCNSDCQKRQREEFFIPHNLS